MARILHPPLPIISAKYIGCTWIIKGGGGQRGRRRVRGVLEGVRGVSEG